MTRKVDAQLKRQRDGFIWTVQIARGDCQALLTKMEDTLGQLRAAVDGEHAARALASSVDGTLQALVAAVSSMSSALAAANGIDITVEVPDPNTDSGGARTW